MNHTPKSSLLRILDAAINRAGEGLRVVEDYLRMVRDDRHLAGLAKQLRHDLAAATSEIGSIDRHASRNTLGDVGTTNTTTSESLRRDTDDVAAASFKRSAEALRTIEEYGKLLDSQLGAACEQLRYRLYTLEKAADLARDAATRLASVRLCILIGGQDSEAQFGELVTSLVHAGVGALQLRDKSLDDRRLLVRARQLVAATRQTDTLAIVNDRPDVAAAVDADGVHLGQDDLPVAAARSIVGPRTLIGVSTHSIDQARQAVLDGANYLGAGPTFASTTKKFDDFPGLGFLGAVADEISLPTFAIGGIDAANLSPVLATGIQRVAVAGAVTAASDPHRAAIELLRLLEHSPAARSASGV